MVFLAGVFVFSAQVLVYAFTSANHPPQVRATALGWSAGVGRVGAICGPLLGGAVLSAGIAVPWGFYAFAVVGAPGRRGPVGNPGPPRRRTGGRRGAPHRRYGGHPAGETGADRGALSGRHDVGDSEGTTKARHLHAEEPGLRRRGSGQPVSVLIPIRSTGSWPGAPGAAPPAVRPRRLSRRSSRPASLVRP